MNKKALIILASGFVTFSVHSEVMIPLSKAQACSGKVGTFFVLAIAAAASSNSKESYYEATKEMMRDRSKRIGRELSALRELVWETRHMDASRTVEQVFRDCVLDSERDPR